jgi:NhaP-type Na+/H+ or K+/H+ antiporter
MATVELIVGLLAVIALLGIVANRARLPHPAILVLGGIALGTHAWRSNLVLSWSGMRGALSLAGALSIPLAVASHPFPARDQVIFFVYCVVLGTLIIPSLTLKALIRRLGLGQSEALRQKEPRAPTASAGDSQPDGLRAAARRFRDTRRPGCAGRSVAPHRA